MQAGDDNDDDDNDDNDDDDDDDNDDDGDDDDDDDVVCRTGTTSWTTAATSFSFQTSYWAEQSMDQVFNQKLDIFDYFSFLLSPSVNLRHFGTGTTWHLTI